MKGAYEEGGDEGWLMSEQHLVAHAWDYRDKQPVPRLPMRLHCTTIRCVSTLLCALTVPPYGMSEPRSARSYAASLYHHRVCQYPVLRFFWRFATNIRHVST
eukprot:1910804-Rhodomonas_salina.1